MQVLPLHVVYNVKGVKCCLMCLNLLPAADRDAVSDVAGVTLMGFGLASLTVHTLPLLWSSSILALSQDHYKVCCYTINY